MSVAKSHSSMASRCVIFEMPHDNAMITEGGKLNLQKIRAMRPEYADVIEKGFEWTILLWQAEEAFPALIDLLQETGNLGQQQAMDETRWQVAQVLEFLTTPGKRSGGGRGCRKNCLGDR